MISNELNSFCTGELSRNELLSWVNNITRQGLSKVQQLGTGTAYCQIIDSIHPRLVPGSKMNYKAKSEYQFINNFKVLQQCFLKLGIYKNIEIEKLVKCKYQDNLEFLQWFHKYFENQIARRDTPNEGSSRNESQNRSIPKRTSSLLIPTNISKIEGKPVDAGSFEEMTLDDLSKPHNSSSQQLTEFYKSKLFEIQELAESWDPATPSGELRDRINQILLRPPQQIVLSEMDTNAQQ